MHVLCLHVAIAAGDYPFSNFMCYSGGIATNPFCCNGQPLPRACALVVQPSFAAIQRMFSLVNSEFTQKQGLYHYKTINGEASVMFRT